MYIKGKWRILFFGNREDQVIKSWLLFLFGQSQLYFIYYESASVSLSTELSRQEGTLEWVALPPPGGLSDPGIEPGSPALQADSLPFEPPGKPSTITADITVMKHALWA